MARVALALAAVAVVACAASGERVGVTSSAIVGGDADTSDGAVVALVDTSSGALCSGTVVAPTVVLTAAHCVSGVAASDLQVVFGDDTTSPSQSIAVTTALAYPTYDSEADGIPGGVDLGAVTLASPAPVSPVAVATDTTDAQLTGADVTVVGYGADDGTDDTGSGTRRSVVLQVTQVCSRVIEAGDADANACVGDSGGAVLLDGRLVAVVSGGSPGCHSPTTFTRTDAHADWIAAIIAGNASSCSACVPPDPSCTAATETEPAGAGQDAGEDAEAGTPPGGGAKSSHDCAIGPSAREPEGAGWLAGLGPVAFLGMALRRRSGRFAGGGPGRRA